MIGVNHGIWMKTIRFQAKTLLGKNASHDFSKKEWDMRKMLFMGLCAPSSLILNIHGHLYMNSLRFLSNLVLSLTFIFLASAAGITLFSQ